MFLLFLLFSLSKPNQGFKKYPNPKAQPWKFKEQRLRSDHCQWWWWLSKEELRKLSHGSSESRGNGSLVQADFPRLKPLPPRAFAVVRIEGFGLGRSGFVGVANLGLLLLRCFWVGCCFVVFLASPFFFQSCWFASFFSFLVCFLLRSLGKFGLLGDSCL